jgi:hypothetical protein
MLAMVRRFVAWAATVAVVAVVGMASPASAQEVTEFRVPTAR